MTGVCVECGSPISHVFEAYQRKWGEVENDVHCAYCDPETYEEFLDYQEQREGF